MMGTALQQIAALQHQRIMQGIADKFASLVSTEEVAALRRPLQATGSLYGLTPAETVASALTEWMHLKWLSYIKEPKGADNWLPPATTLRRGGGDCEDLSILGLSLLYALGLDSAYLCVGQLLTPHGWGGHAWIEGVDARGGFLIEATTGGIRRGLRPGTYRPCLFCSPWWWRPA